MVEIRLIIIEDDLNDVSNIYEQSWKYDYRGIIPEVYLDSIPSGKWTNVENRWNLNTLLAVDDGKLIDTASYGKARINDMEGYGEIVSIYLLYEVIHKGIGRKLMEAVIVDMKKQGYQRIYLWVLVANINARCFYERFGFMLNGKYLTCVFAEKELKEVQYVSTF